MRMRAPGARFDFAALYQALDEQRCRRGISWQHVAREMGVSATTLVRTSRGGPMEGDGILAMLRWLGRTFSDFTPGPAGRVLRASPVGAFHRFDARAIHAALDQRRRARGMTWTQVAAEIHGARASMLTRMAKGGRVGVPLVVELAIWLGRAPEDFTRSARGRSSSRP
jgi:hypothetical protein